MRDFSELDKQILEYLVKDRPEKIEIEGKINASNQVYLILHDILKIKHIYTKDLTFNLIIGYEETANQPDINFWDRFYNLLLLLKFLEENYLIGISTFDNKEIDLKYPGYDYDDTMGWHKDTTSLNNLPDGTTMLSSVPIRTVKTKSNLSSDVARYCNSLFYVTEELKQYVKRGFITQSRIDVEKQLCNAKIQMWIGVVSCAIGVVAIIVAIWISLCR